MAKKDIELTVKCKYTLIVYEEAHLVEIHQGGMYIGRVGTTGASHGTPNELEDAARAYLFEVLPELKNNELGKSDAGPATLPSQSHN